jgi:hypothetical protein
MACPTKDAIAVPAKGGSYFTALFRRSCVPDTIVTSLIGVAGAVIGGFTTTVMGPLILKRFDQPSGTKNDREREESLRGTWVGILRDSDTNEEDRCSIEISVDRGKITATGMLTLQRPDLKQPVDATSHWKGNFYTPAF